MKEVKNLDEVNNIINTGKPVLLYFSGENCSLCHALKPKIEKSFQDDLPKLEILEIKTDVHKELTSHFTVFSLPTILVYFDSKEFKRIGRNISVPIFTQEIKRIYDLYEEANI
ncbi:MAG: thioredoxin family protein [Campylobacteraceae bacterium]|nr:thioredoxin family protein [Campylobacteraceae bacterium]